MEILKKSDRIIIVNPVDFDIKHILECGQVFRFKDLGDRYVVFSKSFKAEVFTYDDRVEIITSDVEYFYNYFDLSADYGSIKKQLLSMDYNQGGKEAKEGFSEIGTKNTQKHPKICSYEYMSAAIEFGSGIRILKQDLFEVIISFIISANNNIKRIQGIIERLCEGLGIKMDGFYAFPTPEQLLKGSVSFFESIGAGYRAKYLAMAAKQLSGQLKQILKKTPARSELQQIMGVGPKVADCILLFGAGLKNVFPVDVWIAKSFSEDFGGSGNREQTARELVKIFGSLSGYAQQYIYYYKRSGY